MKAGVACWLPPGWSNWGVEEEAANQELGEIAARYATDVILVDEQRAPPIAKGLRAAGFPTERLHVVSRLAEAVAWVPNVSCVPVIRCCFSTIYPMRTEGFR